jgi:hypothetical protein
MTIVVGRIVCAVLLATAGLWSWREAARAEATAAAWHDVAALAAGLHVPPSPSALSRWLPGALRGATTTWSAAAAAAPTPT